MAEAAARLDWDGDGETTATGKVAAISTAVERASFGGGGSSDAIQTERRRRNGGLGKLEATATAVARDLFGGDGELLVTLTAARQER